ncbi:MAG: nicotinate (nicotinamide) nucleotide adenylyltransferase [Cyclobacteriaceae bacterium]
MKIGLFFGSFNPIHIGHLIIANVIYENTDCKEIWFVVSPQNPLKKSSNLAHEFDRYDMVQAAINEHFRFKVTDVEFNMPKPSYTIDTLTYLQEKNPKKEFQLIIGSDNLIQFNKWKNSKQILENFSLLVYDRPGSSSAGVDHPNIHKVEAPLLDISATFIRKQIQQSKSVKYLLPEPVVQIIQNRGLYQS